MVKLDVQIVYNKANDRWDMLDMEGNAIFDSRQRGIPDCENVHRIFEDLDKNKVNHRILITAKPREDK